MPDYILAPDDQFNDWLANYKGWLLTNAVPLGLDAVVVGGLYGNINAWNAVWSSWQLLQPQVTSALQSKDQARTTTETLARQVAQMAQMNPAMTDAMRGAAGITIPKGTRTPVAPIITSPVLYRVDNEHLLQRLWFCDTATPGSKAKPKGAAMCEIREQIGGVAPTDPNTMPMLAMETKAPHRNDLDPADVGKTVYYAQRWLNTAGDPGPWSLITNYPVM